MDNKIYYCENCGGVMEFDAASQSLKCPNCGTETKIKNDKKKIVEHSLTRHAMQTITASEKKSQTMICKGCGAKIEVAANSTATSCPYCGSKYVLADKQEDAIIPDGVLPFQIDRNRVGELFRKWLKGRWMAPGELKHLYQQEKLQGIYLPYWTFDAKADARYTAQGGRRRTVTRKGPDGKTVQETVVDWYPTSGSIRHFFDDVLIPASKSLKRNLLDRVGSDARQYMEFNLEEMARQDVLRRYDEVRGVSVRASYSDETYKHVMLPVYATAYTYKGKKYHVLINGQSGRVEGDYPKSPAKIIAIILGILAVIFLIYLFSTGSDDSYYGMRAVPNESVLLTADSQAEGPITLQEENEEAVTWDYSADSLPM